MSFSTLARRAAQRYAAAGRTEMHFAHGKMTMDPVYEAALRDGVLPARGTFLDIGCGQGLMLALLAEASQFDRLIGVEMRPRMARLARTALGDKATIVEDDARKLKFEPCSAAVLFDVLQAMPPDDQEQLLSFIVAALEPRGTLLMRDGDAGAGWRFKLVSIGNELKARVIRTWNQGRFYRTRDEWLALFDRLGLDAEVCETPGRNPLGNVLFRATRR
jgi:SAM-dependent methyltransferase